jgi:hypothetical protein
MIAHAKWSALKQSQWYEYLLRFVLGGLATVLAGVIADQWGPEVGGLFLAFPAVFVASATLIEKHERERKQKRGLAGRRRGTDAAALDAAGAALGTFGLVAFGSVVWWLTSNLGGIALLVASIAWLLVAVVSWYLRPYVRRTRGISK